MPSGVLARFALADTIRPGAADLIARLARIGIVPVLLSGDRAATVEAIGRTLGIADARGDAQPEDKRSTLMRLQANGAIVAMVGDGINDAPSLAQAQVSITLGSATALAQWTADIVVLGDDLSRVADAIVHARRTYRVIRENLVWAFAYNLIAVPAAAFGFVTPLVAALGMSASSLMVVGNALRVARLTEPRAPDGRPAAANAVRLTGARRNGDSAAVDSAFGAPRVRHRRGILVVGGERPVRRPRRTRASDTRRRRHERRDSRIEGARPASRAGATA